MTVPRLGSLGGFKKRKKEEAEGGGRPENTCKKGTRHKSRTPRKIRTNEILQVSELWQEKKANRRGEKGETGRRTSEFLTLVVGRGQKDVAESGRKTDQRVSSP